MTDSPFPPLITSLLRPEAYPHPVEAVRVRETHISWVLLTGQFAYKIKKPVDLGFVDFTTLERRRHFCEEELRLNRRFVSDLYLDVVPISNTGKGFKIGAATNPVEHAVRMRQFDEGQLGLRLLADGALKPSHIDELAEAVASFHETAARVGEQVWESAAHVREPVVENFSELRPLIDDPLRIRQLKEIEDWSLNWSDELVTTFQRRHRDDFVRECHGDLHLGNIVRWQGTMTPFDCIEFNPAFRWIDVMNEVAFLIMDLDDHSRSDLGWRFLNAYLEQTGGYEGLSVLPFYLVYRALVRAKVDALRLRQSGVSAGEQQQLTSQWHGYLDLAARYTEQHAASLMITHGVSGSGKTTETQALLQRQGAIRVRSDVERKRLFNLKPTDDASVAIEAGIYSQEASDRTYDRLAALARTVVGAGYPVIVDATFLKRQQRHRFRRLAAELDVPFRIVEFRADEQTLRERIRARGHEGCDASDATGAVLEYQLDTCEPLARDERPFVISPAAPDTEPISRPDS